MTPHDIGRALASMAHRGEPAPVDAERALASAWRLYTQSGVPKDPGWYAADHALRSQIQVTPAIRLLKDVETDAAGVLVLAGGVGSGRSYACARLLWRTCQLVARGKAARAGRWVSAGDLGQAPSFPDRGTDGMAVETWPAQLRRHTKPHLLILDDLGAAGASQTALDRARKLLEDRFAAGRLTLVSTNVTEPDRVRQLLGARVHDRAEVQVIAGDSLRGHRLRPAPLRPQRITQALARIAALEVLDAKLRQADDVTLELTILTPWLRGTADAATWQAALDDELSTADQQRAEYVAELATVVEALSRPPAPQACPHEALATKRAEHDAKVAALLERGTGS